VAAVASHAGDAAFEVSMRPMLHHAAIAYEAAGGLEAFAAKVADGGPKGPFAFDGLIVMACSAAYAAEPGAPAPHCALPFDPKTAVLNEGWDRWLAHDPLGRLAGLKAAAESLRTVFLDAGDADEHGLHFAARMLFEALREAGATVTYEEFSGGHRGTSYRYGTSLPLLVDALRAD